MSDYTEDYLLDKQIKIFQPVDGYRASSDAVLVSSLVNKINLKDNVLDIGSGTGAISLCLAHRFPQNSIIGLEIQSDLAELANKSAEANRFTNLKFINCDIRQKLTGLPYCSFSHIITNPPYTDHDMPSPNHSKALAHNHQEFDLSGWLNFAIKMLKPQGWIYTINRAEAITEILSVFYKKMGNIEIIPLHSKAGQIAKRVMIKARKDSHTPTKIYEGLVVHDLNGNYTEKAQKILRSGQSFWDK